nr:NADH-quinone oxidoreductase subunit NuoK [Glycomyces amatae]
MIGFLIAVGLFAIGLYGVLTRRNAVMQLAAAELMLGGVHLVLVTADLVHASLTGQSFALFIVVIAAAEVGVGLALILNLWRERATIDTDGLPEEAPGPGVEPHTSAPLQEAPSTVATGGPSPAAGRAPGVPAEPPPDARSGP